MIPYNRKILHKFRKSQADIQKTLQKAEEYHTKFRTLVNTRAELARKEGVSKARITQILHLLNLHPEIKEYLLSLKDQNLIRHFTEEKVRKIGRMEREGQPKEFEKLKKHARKMSANIFK